MTRVNIIPLIFKHHKFKVLFLFITLVVLFNTLLFTHVFTIFEVIKQDDILSYLVPGKYPNDSSLSCSFPLFEEVSLSYPNTHLPDDLEVWARKMNVNEGEWKPHQCASLFSVAIIIPFRNRDQHLKIFLHNIHPFLQQQNIHYKIYVVEQFDKRPFNRGHLFNVGFVEALRDYNFPCFIFHDVDLLPQNLNNIYACTRTPRHMASSIDKFRYVVPYDRNFGGAVAMLQEQFKHVNGFSNNFYGWGGEDDDFFNRVINAGFLASRFSSEISRYASLHHVPAEPSQERFDKLANGINFHKKDGLNKLAYILRYRTYHSSHVRLSVTISIKR